MCHECAILQAERRTRIADTLRLCAYTRTPSAIRVYSSTTFKIRSGRPSSVRGRPSRAARAARRDAVALHRSTRLRLTQSPHHAATPRPSDSRNADTSAPTRSCARRAATRNHRQRRHSAPSTDADRRPGRPAAPTPQTAAANARPRRADETSSHFPCCKSRNIELSNACSATIRFSRAFSCSNARNRCASSSFNAPYLIRQR